jgi:hypothetical protein
LNIIFDYVPDSHVKYLAHRFKNISLSSQP